MYLHRVYDIVVAAERRLPAARVADETPQLTITEHQHRRLPSQQSNPNGYTYELQADGSVHVSWADLFDFVVSADGSRIDVHAEATRHHEPVYTYLLSQIVSVALLGQHIESLHGSAVAIGNRAIVLLGDCGLGKSTLTAALVQSGAKLVTDDLVVLRDNGTSVDVAPGAHRIKLDPHTAAAVGLNWPGVAMADGSGKHVYYVDANSCAEARVAVAAFVLLQPSDHVDLRTVEPAVAVRELLAATFNPLQTDPQRLQKLLLAAQEVSTRVPMMRLHVPRSLERLNEVVSRVRALM